MLASNHVSMEETTSVLGKKASAIENAADLLLIMGCEGVGGYDEQLPSHRVLGLGNKNTRNPFFMGLKTSGS